LIEAVTLIARSFQKEKRWVTDSALCPFCDQTRFKKKQKDKNKHKQTKEPNPSKTKT